MENKKTSVVVRSSFCSMLAILFIALKLIGVTNWNWIWVLAPIWIPTGIGLIMLAILSIIAVVVTLRKKIKQKIK